MKLTLGRSLPLLPMAAGWALCTAASSLALSSPAAAQYGAIVQATPPAMAVERLNQNLTRLSRQPTDMEALIGAGMASYELGDAQAANGFFTRANLVNPRVGRVKLGLALVSVALKQPREAAAYFDEAMALGETANAYLAERALIYDLTGQQDKAQRDYVTALQASPGNSELIRAYAVSLGISGKVDLAEAQLRPLLYRSDRAAWRDRTMILAMNGRTAEARRIAQTIMPRSLADSMEPYLIRMGSLTAGQKAAATHYGQFPADGLRLATMTSPPAAAAPVRASARNDATSRRASRASRTSRDRRKTAAAPVAANAEDSSLLAAMPRGDAPPAMVQAIPSSAWPPVASASSASASRMGGYAAGDDDDPDGYTPAERSQAARALPVPASPATTPVRVATAAPMMTSPRSSLTVQPVQGRPVQGAPMVQPVQGASAQVSAMVQSVPPSSASTPSASLSPAVPVTASASPAASSPTSASPVSASSVSPSASAVAPVTVTPAPATPSASPMSAQAVAQTAQTVMAAAAVPSSVVRPVQGPSIDSTPMLSSASAQPSPMVVAPAASTVPATATAAPTSPSAAVQNAPQPGFTVAPVADLAPAAAPVPPPRTLAAIMADIQVQEDAARAAAAPVVDLDEIARLQAAKRKASADRAAEKAKKEAAAKAKAEADAKLKAEAEEKARIKANPARIWVQIATGRDLAALAFDMRRLRKTYAALAAEDASTAEWGATRRLLVGPYASVTRAKAVLTDLKKAGSDGFVWQSEAGETVSRLSGK